MKNKFLKPILSRRIGLAIKLAFTTTAMVLFMTGLASANYGPHGGFEKDTDACAGCHRAHTSVSLVAFDESKTKNALLVGNSNDATVKSFCYTCHGLGGTGAATDVQYGKLDASVGDSNLNATLNGGGFSYMAGMGVSSAHDMPSATNPDNFGTAYGGIYNDTTIIKGVVYLAGEYDKMAGGISIAMDCSSCHDPHGSSNYRLLKDTVNDTETGGYVTTDLRTAINPNPKPFVISNEIGYPNGDVGMDFGFRLHRQYPDYKPDYTTARYARAPKFTIAADDTVTVDTTGIDASKGLSGWCAGCHTEYNTVSSMGQSAYDANDGLPDTIRHRHPVNIPLTNADGVLDRDILIATDSDTNSAWSDNVDIPLEHNPYSEGQGSNQRQAKTDFVGCLTCHRAHGTNASMTGYALGGSNIDPEPNSSTGVPPAYSSSLLRANNRGVCERCHNK